MIFFIGGSALLGYQVSVIMASVAAREERVTYFLSAIGLGLMGIVLGAYWLIRGLAGYTAIRTLQADPRRIRMFFVVAAIVIVASMAGLKIWLSSLGYAN